MSEVNESRDVRFLLCRAQPDVPFDTDHTVFDSFDFVAVGAYGIVPDLFSDDIEVMFRSFFRCGDFLFHILLEMMNIVVEFSDALHEHSNVLFGRRGRVVLNHGTASIAQMEGAKTSAHSRTIIQNVSDSLRLFLQPFQKLLILRQFPGRAGAARKVRAQ